MYNYVYKAKLRSETCLCSIVQLYHWKNLEPANKYHGLVLYQTKDSLGRFRVMDNGHSVDVSLLILAAAFVESGLVVMMVTLVVMVAVVLVMTKTAG